MTIIKQFVEDNYAPLEEAAKKISGNDPLWQELLHYTIDIFLRKPRVAEIIESGGGRFYCVRIMMNSYRSTTSPFYSTYRKPTEDLSDLGYLEDEEDDSLQTVNRIKAELAKLPWYDRMLFETFVDEGHTISSLSRVTGIPRTSISLTINRIRKHIRKSL